MKSGGATVGAGRKAKSRKADKDMNSGEITMDKNLEIVDMTKVSTRLLEQWKKDGTSEGTVTEMKRSEDLEDVEFVEQEASKGHQVRKSAGAADMERK
jgi:hypothetical protein